MLRTLVLSFPTCTTIFTPAPHHYASRSYTMQAALSKLTGKSSFGPSDVPDLQGRTAVVTGGTGGIGFEVARTLVLSRARVLLLSRKAENAEAAIVKIKESQLKQAGPVADVTFIPCDLGNLGHVKKVADQIRGQEARLDLLICAAGVGVNKFDLSADGIDRHFAVNHLGHFVLTNRLLPLLRQTADDVRTPAPRIICVSSSLHTSAPSSVRFASLAELNNDIGPVALYGRSKLANLLFVKDTIQRVLRPAGDRILMLATHPGAVHTGQQDQFKEAYGTLVGAALKQTVIPFMRNPEQGSLSTLWAATSEEVDSNKEHWNGKYITDPEEAGGESEMAGDQELRDNLWRLSEQLVKEKLGSDGLLPWDGGKNAGK
ncbi:hypothetical protein AcW1_009175 [Taiwanofungus camphoratus]|nr:hypothetical protein AcW1_009175 [Antrodia cinnamomea]